MRTLLTILVLGGLVQQAFAQQLEPNSPGGFLVDANGANPSLGTPFSVYSVAGEPIAFQVGGGGNQPFVLAMGQLATLSTIYPALGGQALDLDQSSVAIVGDGIGGSGVLPASLFQTSPAGTAPFIFPTSPAFVGLTIALQAIVSDPAAPLGLNFTAAAAFTGSNALIFRGNDIVQEFVIPSGPYTFYGNVFTSVDVSSNGWVRFGGATSFSSGSFPIPAALINGQLGGGTFVGGPLQGLSSPGIAALWADLDFSSPGAEISVAETSPGVLTIDWTNAEAAGTNTLVGSFRCSVDTTFGSPLVVLDYGGVVTGANFPFAPSGIPIGPIVGVADGGTAGAQVIDMNLVTAGVLNAVTPSTSPNTYIQDFQGLAGTPAETFDLAGLSLNFLDQSLNSSGNFNLF